MELWGGENDSEACVFDGPSTHSMLLTASSKLMRTYHRQHFIANVYSVVMTIYSTPKLRNRWVGIGVYVDGLEAE